MSWHGTLLFVSSTVGAQRADFGNYCPAAVYSQQNARDTVELADYAKRSGAHGIGSTRIPQRRTRTCTRRIVPGALHAFTMQRNVDWPLFDNALKVDRCKTSSGGQPLKLLVVMGVNAPFQ